MHATDFLRKFPAEFPAVIVLSGGQPHLQSLVLQALRHALINDDETSLSRFPGKETELAAVSDELRTVSMWGDRRLVVVDDADDFVSRCRAGLEKLVGQPRKKSVLVLIVQSWPKTTRLAKQLAETGLEIECAELKGVALTKWLTDTAKETYGATLPRDAAALLIELIGGDLGMLSQELLKLASFAGDKRTIAVEDVRSLVGGWRTETTWAMTDAVRDGHLADALTTVNQLMDAGEAPQKLLGGINFVFRKLCYAVELSRTQPLDQALKQAGVFPRDAVAASTFLRRIGRAKAERLLAALVACDAGLKGASKLPDRTQMELLLSRLAGAV